MRVSNEEIISKLTIWSIIMAAMGLAVYFGIAVSEASYYTLLLVVGGILGLVWVVVAKDRWWLPFPLAVAMGGFFYLGFKIYLHEFVLALCLLPLIVNIATRKEMVILLRERIPAPVWILTLYLVAHWLICIAVNKIAGVGGVGSVSRQYMNAGWPLVIFFAFYLYGNSRHLKTALLCMYWIYVLRVAMGLYYYVTMPEQSLVGGETQALVYIPLINYVPSTAGAADLRGSTTALASLSLGYCSMTKGSLGKLFHFSVAMASIGINLLGGGRTFFVICLILVAFWFMISRKILPLVLIGFLIVSLLALVNSDPFMVETLPKPMQRALSGLVFTTDQLQVQKDAQSSNEYHARLREMGYDRWTESLLSILVGHGIQPFDEGAWNDKTTDNVTRFSEQAKLTGRFEMGLWTVLATFGGIGLILYLSVMWFLVRDFCVSLWRDGIPDREHIFYFLASFMIMIWIITMVISGGFPSQEIMMALFAKVAYEDSVTKRKAAQATAPLADSRSNLLPV